MRPIYIFALSMGLVAGCGSPEPEAEAVATASDAPLVGASSCNEDVFAPLVGRSLDVLDTIEIPEKTRVIAPGAIVTTEYLPQRLNVEHNDRGAITKAWCG
ncbi:I78 family peptidase inhibitor [Shimia abyssi]|uniref:Peptidase inhibitor I78 family protein n=1 Tax=Shimia abyssi TaxID=1662395 RepID=A0A2P8FKT6_9RHOB|nr:I78 family peptidase inhibitor [Shimia abyssi]PSL22333.1 peptidase inhibitor I78 family protein [Shimia abyssi]